MPGFPCGGRRPARGAARRAECARSPLRREKSAPAIPDAMPPGGMALRRQKSGRPRAPNLNPPAAARRQPPGGVFAGFPAAYSGAGLIAASVRFPALRRRGFRIFARAGGVISAGLRLSGAPARPAVTCGVRR